MVRSPKSQEIVGGFAIFEVKSKEEALNYTRRFLEIALKFDA
jgi:hypothetical protein